jgi:hypothetical protein
MTIPINLDALSPEELLDKAKNYIGVKDPWMHALFMYCSEKAQAMHFRLRGDISHAEFHERVCESIYAVLPEDLKW